MKKKKYLIVKLSAIGDVLMCLHAGRYLKNQEYQIDWAVGKTSSSFVDEEGFNQTIVLDEKKLLKSNFITALVELLGFWRSIFFNKYDVIFVGHSDFRYLLLVLPKLITTKVRLFQPVKGRHHTEEYIRMVSCKDEAQSYMENLEQSNSFRQKDIYEVCVAPGGAKNLLRSDWQRRWPIEKYRQLIEILSQLPNVKFTILGSHSDSWVLKELHGIPFNNEIGKLNLSKLKLKIQESDLFITHDSGPMHVGLQTSTPVLSIFGPTDDREKFYPNNFKSMVVKSSKEEDCMPCYNGKEYLSCSHHSCMNNISVESVTLKVKEVLNL